MTTPMPDTLAEGQVEELKRLLEKATPGEWHALGGYLCARPSDLTIYNLDELGVEQEPPHRFQAVPFAKAADAEFIAAAKRHLPALLATVERVGALEGEWRDIDEHPLPRDDTILATVEATEANRVFFGSPAQTHPIYVDPDGVVCCSGRWTPDPGIAAGMFKVTAWKPLPAPYSRTLHASDCAVHNAPALPVGPCNCGAAVLAAEHSPTTPAARSDSDGAETQKVTPQ